MPQQIPDITGGQLHDGAIDKGPAQGTMRCEVRILQIFVPFDTLAATRTFILADTQHNNGRPETGNIVQDELGGGLDFQPVRAPPHLLVGTGIAFADE